MPNNTRSKRGARTPPLDKPDNEPVPGESGTPETPLFSSLSEFDGVLGRNWNDMHPGTTQLLLDLDQENHFMLKHDPLPLGDHELGEPIFPADLAHVGPDHSNLGRAGGEAGAINGKAGANKRKAEEQQHQDPPRQPSPASAGNTKSNNNNNNNNATTPHPHKKHTLSKDAAVAKADRERKRRERLNKCFEELAQACAEPFQGPVTNDGEIFKTDRMGIIVDAIKIVKALRVEVGQLRQLNKFMEERVGQLERGRMADAYSNFQGADAGPSGYGGGYGGYPLLRVPAKDYPMEPNNMGNRAYLPPSNLSEDEKLRPPAA